MRNRRRADRQRMTAAQEQLNAGLREIAQHNQERRLVGCKGCNGNFYRDKCDGVRIPYHYRVRPNGGVGLCEGSGSHFKKAHEEGVKIA